ncbi:MAG: S41 family peptidase [Planctomycetota bacterium]
MSQRNLLIILFTLVLSYTCYVRAEQNPYARYVSDGYSVIERWALQDVPDQRLFEGAMRGMVNELRSDGDDHSVFVPEQVQGEFRLELRQEFGGVGIRLGLLGEPPMPIVVGPPQPGTPAFLADIRSGDVILAVDGTPTEGLPISEIVGLTRGEPGEPVVLTLRHQGETEPEDVSLTRAVINVESVRGDIRDDDGRWVFQLPHEPRIAYIRLINFGDKTEEELDTVMRETTKAGAEAFILDVRDNYGGALDAAVGISDMFLRAGLPIVTTRGRDALVRDRFVSTGKGRYTDVPLAILVNKNSASASEIVAACLQDYEQAAIVGERTYGKGTVQRLMPVESGRSILKLTSATYWRPSGKNIHRMPDAPETEEWGVSPDSGLRVELSEEDYLNWRNYRRRRDILGTKTDGVVAEQFDKDPGPLPAGYADDALDAAIDCLRQQLNR